MDVKTELRNFEKAIENELFFMHDSTLLPIRFRRKRDDVSLASLVKKTKKKECEHTEKGVVRDRVLESYANHPHQEEGEIPYVPNDEKLYKNQLLFAKLIGIDLED